MLDYSVCWIDSYEYHCDLKKNSTRWPVPEVGIAIAIDVDGDSGTMVMSCNLFPQTYLRVFWDHTE